MSEADSDPARSIDIRIETECPCAAARWRIPAGSILNDRRANHRFHKSHSIDRRREIGFSVTLDDVKRAPFLPILP